MNNFSEKKLTDSYNNKATERDGSETQNWKVKERGRFLNYLKEEKAGNLLEIGAGPGKDSLFFKMEGFDAFSTDISPEMVKLCRQKGLVAEVMDFAALDFPDNQFDAVWALNCLLHVPKNEIEKVLMEIKRVLKYEGIFFMGVYGGTNHEGVWKEDNYSPKRFFSFFDDASLRKLLSEYFTVEYFNVVPKEVVGGEFHFQSVILRNVHPSN